ncbi:dead box ATP-dependent RNA helicase [Dorcoceras hygrometricum]|uniref:Dead box ATP-dependent RNA helicase n=1 Tax=Dorcoceras hygrometricum TaxID=472368 RepID=A0A2Z7BVE3_9LAMI|nr:dead box ATP-dependent RNA helicase [Dorcoceras hygrometricum]
MSLFDLHDVCIDIGSITTLDLPMVVDLIGIYGLKGPYCTLTTTNWFLQALSLLAAPLPFSQAAVAAAVLATPPPPLAGICSGQLFEENPSVLISSGLLVQADEGTLLPVVDLIRTNLQPPTVKSQSPCDSGWSQAPVASKEERYKRDEEADERNVERSKEKSKDKFKERSKDRSMKSRGDKRPSRKYDRKVLVAEESTKSWADTDSESSSSSSSSSNSEQEEVHCLMADQTSDDEVFDFSNIEFTREDLVKELNDLVKEYMKLSHSFEEAKAENMSLKSSSIESSSDELEDIDSLKTELSKLTAENDNSPKLSENGKAGIGFSKPESSKPNWLKNKLDKDKAKAGQKPFVPNQPWRSSKKLQVVSHCLTQLQFMCSGGTVDKPVEGSMSRWRVPVVVYTSCGKYQS